MSKAQYWILNCASLLLVTLLLAHYWLSRSNNNISNDLTRAQAYIGNARQVEPVLDQMAKRIAKGSEADPRLKDILVKYGLSVTLNNEGQTKTYP